MLLHYGTDGTVGHALDFIKYAEQAKKANKLLEDIYLERIKEKHPSYTREDLKTKISFDCYLSAKGAAKLGLVDKIVGEE